MSKPNVHGLPPHLRKDGQGYFLDYFIQEEGLTKRKRARLGQIPLVQAKKILARHMEAIAERKFLAPEQPKASFSEAADSFLAYSRARKKSYAQDERVVAGMKAFFGDRALDSLTPDLVEEYLAHRNKQGHQRRPGGSLSGCTLNREVACLKTIVNRAILNRKIDRNPIQGIRRFKEYSRNRTLTQEEFQELLRNCAVHLQPLVKLAYLTGMRYGEIRGLRWDQVDLKNRVITLEAADTKTQEKREIPLADTFVQLFQRIPRTLGCPNVFTYMGQPIGTIKTAFTMACRRAGIKDFRFHDLRHCAVTNLRKAGVSDSVIMSISGHKTDAVFRKYDRVDRDDRKNALQRVESLIDTGMTLVENHAAL
jgi:integrase